MLLLKSYPPTEMKFVCLLSLFFLTSPSPLSCLSHVPLSNHLYIAAIPVELVMGNVDIELFESLTAH